MECSSVLVSSIKPIVWFARCVGQLPVIWNEQQGRWHVAPWYHPQYLYFVCLLLFRIFIYGCQSYANLTTMFMTNSLSLSVSHAAECVYTWLRLVLAPYALLFSVRPLNEAFEKMREVDSILGIRDKKTYCRKPQMFTFLTILEAALVASLLAVFSKYVSSWYDSKLPNLRIGSLVLTWSCLDLVMETTVLAQFCLGSILLQQRLATLCFQLKQFYLPAPFLSHIDKGPDPRLNCRKQCSLQLLQNSYTLLCQASKGICEGFGWPMLFLSLGNTTVFTISVYAVSKPTAINSVLGANDDLINHYFTVLICQSLFILNVVSYFADKTTNEVSNLQMDLQILASRSRSSKNYSELKQDLWQFYQTVCLSPPEKPTAARFYSLGRSLLPGVLGVVVTYSIVLMQYETSENRETDSLNQTCVSHRTI